MTSYVGSAYVKADASGTTATTTSSIAVQAGDLILAFAKNEDGTTTVTISDDASGGSNTYTARQERHHGSANLDAGMYSAIAKASETLTFTATLGAARSFRSLHVSVHRPTAGKTFVYDNSASASNSATSTPTTGAFSVAGVGGAAMAGFAEYAGGTWTQGTGWTERVDDGSYSETRILTSETSIEGNATWTSTDSSIAVAVAFKEESAGSSYIPRMALLGVG